jgi:hypothetical protein
MDAAGPDDGLSVSCIHDDKQRREEFDRQLASYIRSHGERWDLTAIVETLDMIGRRVGEVEVGLHRRPSGALSVTMTSSTSPASHQRQFSSATAAPP